MNQNVDTVYADLLEKTRTGQCPWSWTLAGYYECGVGTLSIAHDQDFRPRAVLTLSGAGRYLADDLWRLVARRYPAADVGLPAVTPSLSD